jgi:chaperonin GroEL (HSP60 family)
VELAELQDREVGDGTTSVVIIAAELLKVMIGALTQSFNCLKISLLLFTSDT